MLNLYYAVVLTQQGVVVRTVEGETIDAVGELLASNEALITIKGESYADEAAEIAYYCNQTLTVQNELNHTIAFQNVGKSDE